MIFVYILLALLGFFLLYILFLILCAAAINPKREYDKNSNFYRFLLNSVTGIVLKMMRIKVHVTGLEKIPADARPVFVGNHRSNFDPIISWYILRRWKPAFISKPSNFKIPIFGRYILKCCFMAIDRENPRNAMKTINKAAALIQKGEVSVGVYPEGTRSKDGRLLPFHNGVFKIAQKANAPLVVMSIAGTEKIYKSFPFRASHVYLDFLEVLDADTVRELKTDAIGEQVRFLISRRLEELEGRAKDSAPPVL